MVVNTVCLLAILYRHNGEVMNIDIIDYCQIQGCPTSAQTHTCPVSCGFPFPEMGNQFSEERATGPGIPGLVNIQKNYGTSPFLVGKSTISMIMFNRFNSKLFVITRGYLPKRQRSLSYCCCYLKRAWT